MLRHGASKLRSSYLSEKGAAQQTATIQHALGIILASLCLRHFYSAVERAATGEQKSP
jgi:hypothetical protein